MKLISVFCILLMASISQAEDKSSGCGLGWKVTSRQSLLSSAIRNYTNSTASSTFGMTSGTSGCDRHSIVKNESKEIHFAESNFNSLMVEMAKGQGEYLKGFAMVMGCKENQTNDFSRAVQKNYNNLFPNQGSNPSQLVNDVNHTLNVAGVCQASI